MLSSFRFNRPQKRGRELALVLAEACRRSGLGLDGIPMWKLAMDLLFTDPSQLMGDMFASSIGEWTVAQFALHGESVRFQCGYKPEDEEILVLEITPCGTGFTGEEGQEGPHYFVEVFVPERSYHNCAFGFLSALAQGGVYEAVNPLMHMLLAYDGLP